MIGVIKINIIKNINEDVLKITSKNNIDKLAMAKLLYISACKYLYRNEEFFLFKENLKLRNEIYNKSIDYTNMINGSITCKSFCELMAIVYQSYGIKNNIIEDVHKRYTHNKMAIYVAGKRYLIDPLMDLLNVKIKDGLKFFGSIPLDNNCTYSLISDEHNKKIDATIGYDSMAYQKFIEKKYTCLDEILHEMKYIDSSISTVEIKMILKKVFSDLNIKNLKIIDYFVDDCDLVDLKEYVNDNKRHRGVIIKNGDIIYLISNKLNHKKITNIDWKKIISRNNLRVNEFIEVNCLKDLREFGLDEEILHNRFFLNFINQFEKTLAFNSEYIIDFITVNKSSISIDYKDFYCNIYIEDDTLCFCTNCIDYFAMYENNNSIRILSSKKVLKKVYK